MKPLSGTSINPDQYEVSSAQLGSIRPATAEQKLAAISFLQRNLHHDRLPGIAAWDGEVLDGWLDLFGLNERPMRITHRHQSHSVAYPSR